MLNLTNINSWITTSEAIQTKICVSAWNDIKDQVNPLIWTVAKNKLWMPSYLETIEASLGVLSTSVENFAWAFLPTEL